MKLPARPLVLLDRDGVINRDSTEYIKSVREWVPLPGSLEAIASLRRAGFLIAVVSNQSGVGRGLFSEQRLTEINEAMLRAVAKAGGGIDGVYYCPHRPDDGCNCRKPKPGLLLRAAEELGAEIEATPFIGDKLSDIEAARAAGARPILVGPLVPTGAPYGVETYKDLAAASESLIAENRRRR